MARVSDHYGALQGRNKAEVRATYGDQQFMAWRRGDEASAELTVPNAVPLVYELDASLRPLTRELAPSRRPG
jgi:bisphosphoglycerate-dependent phosphoglycerate mutase